MRNVKILAATLAALSLTTAANASGPTKCYYGTSELGYVCSSVVPSWNDRGKAFDEIEKYFADHNLRPTLTEGGCTEIAHRSLPVTCAIDLGAPQN